MKQGNETEEKSARFTRLAVKRTNAALKAIRLIGNLSNQSHYSYTQEEVKMVFSELSRAIEEAKQKFNAPKEQPRNFSFGNKQ